MVAGDVVADFRFPDGEVGPAIFANPRKTLHRAVISTKAITEQVYGWLREYIEFAQIRPDEPLWLASLNPRRGYEGNTISNLIVSTLDRPSERDLLVNPYFRAIGSDWPTRRLSAGTLRHLAAGLGWDGGLDWITAHREDVNAAFSTLPGEPDLFAKVLLDHGLRELGARYRDAASDIGRKRYGRIAALGAYEHLLGERGARRSVDAGAVAETRERLASARAQETAAAAEVDRIERQLVETDVRALNAQERELYLLEASQALIRLLRLARELNAAGKQTERAEAALEKAMTILIPIDDLAEPIAAEALVEPDFLDDEPDLPVLRDFAWPEEFRRAIGENVLPPSTLRRWMAGKHPRPLGDRRNLIEPSMVEALTPGGRVRRIRLDRLDWTRFPEPVQERLEAIRRTPDPRARPQG